MFPTIKSKKIRSSKIGTKTEGQRVRRSAKFEPTWGERKFDVDLAEEHKAFIGSHEPVVVGKSQHASSGNSVAIHSRNCGDRKYEHSL